MDNGVYSTELAGRYGSMADYVSTYAKRRHHLLWHIDNLHKLQAKGYTSIRGIAIANHILADDRKIQRLDKEYHELAKPKSQWKYWSVN